MKIKKGDKVLVEQAWEDESGAYHDEYAFVKKVNKDGRLDLEFEGTSIEADEFLQYCEFFEKDVVIVKSK